MKARILVLSLCLGVLASCSLFGTSPKKVCVQDGDFEICASAGAVVPSGFVGPAIAGDAAAVASAGMVPRRLQRVIVLPSCPVISDGGGE